MDSLWDTIEQTIVEASGQRQSIQGKRPSSGGCINETFGVTTTQGRWFVKLNTPAALDAFKAEAEALDALHQTQTIRVPHVLACGTTDERSFLIMDWLDISHPIAPSQFGHSMAQLHAAPTPSTYGWHRDNVLGTTHQINTIDDDWLSFFAQHRLGHQSQLARKNGAPKMLLRSLRRLSEHLSDFYVGYDIKPALLHGDLWSGNWGGLADGTPIIFDPASYYGDHEADLAMMELFGHPGPSFFDSYAEVLPIDKGYAARKVLYNLYHVLNHFNLFGGSYADQAQIMTNQLLAERN